MSVEQIKREFPFLRCHAFPSYDVPKEAEVNVRVSRLSLEALRLPMRGLQESDVFVFIQSVALGEKGTKIEICGHETYRSEFKGTLGDALLRDFWPDQEELSSEVRYVIYTVDTATSIWRRRQGAKKSYKTWVTKRFESVIFKMPKNKTFWQLLKRYKNAK